MFHRQIDLSAEALANYDQPHLHKRYIDAVRAHAEIGNPLQMSNELLHHLSFEVPDPNPVVPSAREDQRGRRGVAESDAGNDAVMGGTDRAHMVDP